MRDPSTPYSIRLTVSERNEVARAAARSGKTVSEYVRSRLFSASPAGDGTDEILARLVAVEARLVERIAEVVEVHSDVLGERQKHFIAAEFQALKSGVQTGLGKLAELIQRGGR